MESLNSTTDRRTRLGLTGRSVLTFGVLALGLPFTARWANADENLARSRNPGHNRDRSSAS